MVTIVCCCASVSGASAHRMSTMTMIHKSFRQVHHFHQIEWIDMNGISLAYQVVVVPLYYRHRAERNSSSSFLILWTTKTIYGFFWLHIFLLCRSLARLCLSVIHYYISIFDNKWISISAPLFVIVLISNDTTFWVFNSRRTQWIQWFSIENIKFFSLTQIADESLELSSIVFVWIN